MDDLRFYTGKKIELLQMLEEREERAKRQKKLLAKNPEKVLLSFTMNIPGPVKAFPLAHQAFISGLPVVEQAIRTAGGRRDERYIRENETGYEMLALISGDARRIKKEMVKIEETHPCGRLYDLDILDENGRKLERGEVVAEEQEYIPKNLPENTMENTLGIERVSVLEKDAKKYKPRTCIICGKPAAICARSRAHGLEELQKKTARILYEFCAEQRRAELEECARRAVLSEVETTPKPGLVDLENQGAHRDMDYALFVKSVKVLTPWFGKFAWSGLTSELSENQSEKELFRELRRLGRQAEIEMFRETKGVNTHKGMIFSMAVVCGAAGKLFSEGKECTTANLSEKCAEIARYSLEDFEYISGENSLENSGKLKKRTFKSQSPEKKGSGEFISKEWSAGDKKNEKSENDAYDTHGIILYKVRGIQGARKEAAEGFPTVLHFGLSVLQDALKKGESLNTASIRALLSMMGETEDTNLIARSDEQTWQWVKTEAKKLCRISKENEFIKEVEQFDKTLTNLGLSPGGSADLLAITLMFHQICAG